MPLSRLERKDRLPRGAQKRIAKRLGLADSSLVSRVVNTEKTGTRHERIEREVAKALGLPVTEVFPPRPREAA